MRSAPICLVFMTPVELYDFRIEICGICPDKRERERKKKKEVK